MNSKATIKANVIYILLLMFFVIGMSAFIGFQSNGAAIWSDYYAKEISRIINTATPGETVTLDVHKATEIAVANDMRDYSKIFEFHNEKNEVCVKISPYVKSCYSYFNQVDVADYQIIQGEPINLLTFKIQEKPHE